MHSVYCTYTGALQYGATFSRMTMFINLAKTLNPNIKANEIQKGMKLYDWDNSLFFALTISECAKLMSWWESGQHNDKFHLIHKSQDGNSFFDFSKYNDKYYISISKGNDNRLQMSLPVEELKLFLKSVNWVCNEMIMVSDMLKEMGKIQHGNSSFNVGNDRNGKPFQNNNQNNNNQQRYDNYNPRTGATNNNHTPPPAPPAPQQYNPSNVPQQNHGAPPAPPAPQQYSPQPNQTQNHNNNQNSAPPPAPPDISNMSI